MKCLIACEFSGIVRTEFAKLGWDAWSCDLLPTEIPGPHIQDDVLNVLNDDWDLMIGHPPCTYLAICGLHYSKNDPIRMNKTIEAYNFFLNLYNANIPFIAIENPVGYVSTHFRKPDQIINPYNFGTPERKKTCLWLKNLPKLKIINDIPPLPIKSILRKSGSQAGKTYNYYWRQGKTAKERSTTFPCIAKALAIQLTEYIINQKQKAI